MYFWVKQDIHRKNVGRDFILSMRNWLNGEKWLLQFWLRENKVVFHHDCLACLCMKHQQIAIRTQQCQTFAQEWHRKPEREPFAMSGTKNSCYLRWNFTEKRRELHNKRKWIGFKCRLCKSSTSRLTAFMYPKTQRPFSHVPGKNS